MDEDELPVHTINEISPDGVRALLIAKPKGKSDENQLTIPFPEED